MNRIGSDRNKRTTNQSLLPRGQKTMLPLPSPQSFPMRLLTTDVEWSPSVAFSSLCSIVFNKCRTYRTMYGVCYYWYYSHELEIETEIHWPFGHTRVCFFACLQRVCCCDASMALFLGHSRRSQFSLLISLHLPISSFRLLSVTSLFPFN